MPSITLQSQIWFLFLQIDIIRNKNYSNIKNIKFVEFNSKYKY
jgi:hypothetical protein